jgi:hypothetical protein
MNWKKIIWVIAAIIILGGVVYWYVYRPYKARRFCANQGDRYYAANYDRCMHSWGL